MKVISLYWESNAYHQYRVVKSIENVSMGEIAPAFKQTGRGIQY
ncbi:glycohydrolase toxin TNT-related protein [Dendrosporobacter sp. 1207_IL3150]